MKILVCISNVPDTTTKVKFVDDLKRLDTNGIQWVINPWDELSLTRALELRDDPASGITSVTVAHVGLISSEPTIRKALALGADDAIRVNAETHSAERLVSPISFQRLFRLHHFILFYVEANQAITMAQRLEVCWQNFSKSRHITRIVGDREKENF